MDGDEIIDPAAGLGDSSGTATPPDSNPAGGTSVGNDPGATPPASGVDGTGNDTPGDDDPYAGLYETVDGEGGSAEAEQVPPNGLPPEVTEASTQSQFFKDPTSLPAAIKMADELQGVRTGATHVGDFIDAFRGADPQRYASVIEEAKEYLQAVGAIPKIEGDQKPVDPAFAAMQKELADIRNAETQRQEAAKKQEFEQQRTATTQKYNEHLSTLTKGTWLEGTEGDFSNRVLSQLDKMGVKPQDFASALAKGDTAQLDKAVKMAKNEVLDMVKMYSKNLLDKKAAFRRTTPASPGQGGGPVSKNTSGLPQRSDFPAGDAGESAFHKAMAEAAFAK
jgi:hypothetical protein